MLTRRFPVPQLQTKASEATCGYVIKAIIFLWLAFAAQLIAAESRHVVINKSLGLRRVLLQHCLDVNALRLVEIDDVRTGRECFGRSFRVLLHISMSGRRGERRSRNFTSTFERRNISIISAAFTRSLVGSITTRLILEFL